MILIILGIIAAIQIIVLLSILFPGSSNSSGTYYTEQAMRDIHLTRDTLFRDLHRHK